MENISINCINVQKQVKGALLISGMSNLKEVDGGNLSALATDITLDQIDNLKRITSRIKDEQKSMYDLIINKEESKISESSKREAIFMVKNIQAHEDTSKAADYFVDEMFGLGEVTEVCGPSGCCKTQIAMQL